ncbi:MAG: hypothetical protein R2724_29580 [Bryobacterales bacterium]
MLVDRAKVELVPLRVDGDLRERNARIAVGVLDLCRGALLPLEAAGDNGVEVQTLGGEALT